MRKQQQDYIPVVLDGSPYKYAKNLANDVPLGFRSDDEWKKRFPWLRDGALREYVLEEYLGRGAFSIAFRARVRKGNGFYKMPVVVKFPYINPASDRQDYWKEFTERNYINEFSLITRQLEGCHHANPI